MSFIKWYVGRSDQETQDWYFDTSKLVEYTPTMASLNGGTYPAVTDSMYNMNFGPYNGAPKFSAGSEASTTSKLALSASYPSPINQGDFVFLVVKGWIKENNGAELTFNVQEGWEQLGATQRATNYNSLEDNLANTNGSANAVAVYYKKYTTGLSTSVSVTSPYWPGAGWFGWSAQIYSYAVKDGFHPLGVGLAPIKATLNGSNAQFQDLIADEDSDYEFTSSWTGDPGDDLYQPVSYTESEVLQGTIYSGSSFLPEIQTRATWGDVTPLLVSFIAIANTGGTLTYTAEDSTSGWKRRAGGGKTPFSVWGDKIVQTLEGPDNSPPNTGYNGIFTKFYNNFAITGAASQTVRVAQGFINYTGLLQFQVSGQMLPNSGGLDIYHTRVVDDGTIGYTEKTHVLRAATVSEARYNDQNLSTDEWGTVVRVGSDLPGNMLDKAIEIQYEVGDPDDSLGEPIAGIVTTFKSVSYEVGAKVNLIETTVGGNPVTVSMVYDDTSWIGSEPGPRWVIRVKTQNDTISDSYEDLVDSNLKLDGDDGYGDNEYGFDQGFLGTSFDEGRNIKFIKLDNTDEPLEGKSGAWWAAYYGHGATVYPGTDGWTHLGSIWLEDGDSLSTTTRTSISFDPEAVGIDPDTLPTKPQIVSVGRLIFDSDESPNPLTEQTATAQVDYGSSQADYAYNSASDTFTMRMGYFSEDPSNDPIDNPGPEDVPVSKYHEPGFVDLYKNYVNYTTNGNDEGLGVVWYDNLRVSKTITQPWDRYSINVKTGDYITIVSRASKATENSFHSVYLNPVPLIYKKLLESDLRDSGGNVIQILRIEDFGISYTKGGIVVNPEDFGFNTIQYIDIQTTTALQQDPTAPSVMASKTAAIKRRNPEGKEYWTITVFVPDMDSPPLPDGSFPWKELEAGSSLYFPPEMQPTIMITGA